MARNQTTLAHQQARLKLKSEQLALRVKANEQKERLKQVTNQLKSMGGRIR